MAISFDTSIETKISSSIFKPIYCCQFISKLVRKYSLKTSFFIYTKKQEYHGGKAGLLGGQGLTFQLNFCGNLCDFREGLTMCSNIKLSLNLPGRRSLFAFLKFCTILQNEPVYRLKYKFNADNELAIKNNILNYFSC